MLSDDGKKSSRKWEMEKEMESVCVCVKCRNMKYLPVFWIISYLIDVQWDNSRQAGATK